MSRAGLRVVGAGEPLDGNTAIGFAPAAEPRRPPPPWTPPGPRRRVLLTLAVLVVAAAVARFAPAPRHASTEIAGAREVTAYELGAGATLTFALPPGGGDLRVLTNLDLEPALLGQAVPYAVRVRVPEEGRDDTFPLVATAALDDVGARTAFFLGRPQTPARTRILALGRQSGLPATLELTLLAAAPLRASLRVLVGHERLGARPQPAGPVPATGALAIEELAPEARAALEGQAWSRLATRDRTPTRGFYVVSARPAPVGLPPGGEPVGEGRVAAFTLRGPGTLTLEPSGAELVGVARWLDGQGAVRSERLNLRAGSRRSLPVAPGLVTLRIEAARATRVRVLALPRLALDAGQAVPSGTDEVELTPDWAWQALALTGPAEPPVEMALEGRGGAAVRVTARVPLPSSAAAAPVRLTWRFADGRGATLREGKQLIPAVPAPEDRLDGPAAPFVSSPTAWYLWPPRGAQRLLFTSERPVALAVASPALEPAPATDPELARGVVLRHQESDAFHGVRPLNAAELRRAGRLVRFGGAVRLEALPRPPVPAAASSLAPERGAGQFVILAPLSSPAPARGAGVSWVVRAAHDEVMSVQRPRGASARARVGTTIHYEVTRLRGRVALTVSLDGQVVRRASVLGKRGQILLPPLSIGRHRLRVDLPAPAHLSVDQPVAGAPAFRRCRAHALVGGTAVVRLPKGSGPRSLGVVLYSDGPGHAPALEAVVDGGSRLSRGPGVSRDYTRLRRRVPLVFTRLEGARYLNRAQAGIWASSPVFIPLGDDLAPGPHRISLRTHGLQGPVARFFSYGAPLGDRISQHLELRAELSP